MKKTIGVIGVGNPLRRDDGIGLLLLDHLKEQFGKDMHQVMFLDGGTGGMNLLHLFNRFDIVLLLDAVKFGGEPGEFMLFSIDDIRSQKKSSEVSTHHQDILDIVRIAKELHQCPKHLFVFAVQPAEMCFGKGLSEILGSKFDDMCEGLLREFHQLLDTYT